jgi:2-keto-4-pentenoate hydratase/2-oxohepta-3-ene-1,7-dioic acid hydratase in catechol pathway
MRLVSFSRRGKEGFGAVVGEGVVDLHTRLGGRYADLKAALTAGGLGELRPLAERQEPDFPLSEIEYRLPITAPDKILCVGRNYRAYHEVQEMGEEGPKWPSIFARFANSFVPHKAPIIKPREGEQLDYEGELAVIIGKRGRHIEPPDALSYVAGYSCLNEGSLRDWASRGTQNCPAKNFYHSGSIGPWLVTAEEVPDPTKLNITTKLSGEVRQDGGTDLMIFDIPFVISHISKFTWLEPGDVIATGSPGGSAIEMDPPRWMNEGDRLEVKISGIGTLTNPVVAE